MLCYRLARELKEDVDIVKGWSMEKVLGWVAFFKADDEVFQERVRIERMTKEQQITQHKKNIAMFDLVADVITPKSKRDNV